MWCCPTKLFTRHTCCSPGACHTLVRSLLECWCNIVSVTEWFVFPPDIDWRNSYYILRLPWPYYKSQDINWTINWLVSESTLKWHQIHVILLLFQGAAGICHSLSSWSNAGPPHSFTMCHSFEKHISFNINNHFLTVAIIASVGHWCH